MPLYTNASRRFELRAVEFKWPKIIYGNNTTKVNKNDSSPISTKKVNTGATPKSSMEIKISW